ncbi:MAG: type VI secretion system ATPase TssH [Planctomycetes bacterium]|nr:type VI secretion system ATPase TssH [Planctomycetota bacterium]
MTEIRNETLFGKLDPLCFETSEGATIYAKLRGNPHVELVHWIHQILQHDDSDVLKILQHFEIENAHLAADLVRALDKLPRGASSIQGFSERLLRTMKEAWTYSSLLFRRPYIRSGHIVVAWLKTDSLREHLRTLSKQFDKIRVDELVRDFDKIVGGSPEDGQTASDGSAGTMAAGSPGEASGAMAPAAMGKGEALAKYTVDLTARAKAGEIDPIVGRDNEIRQIVDILMRRRQNNPILTGEAGVGKTAVVEGFALRLARGDVPPSLKDVQLRSLDVGALQAGASMKGEFENRLKQIIEEVHASPQPIVMFIDEAHTLVGAGGAAGTGDAANLLKPALARGTLRTIAATTWAEYKKHIEPDPALTRRFQTVAIDEPTEARAILMMRSIASVLEKHHGVQLLDEAIEAAVKLSHRYIPARQLPDKSVSLLDTACARVAISQHAVPAEVEDCQRRIEALHVELEIIDREEDVGLDVTARRATAQAALAEAETERARLQARWDAEKAIVDRLLETRAALRGRTRAIERTASAAADAADAAARTAEAAQPELAPAQGPARADLLHTLTALQTELAELQGDAPLILPTVDEQAVASVVADWTGVPVGRMVKDEIQAVLDLANTLQSRVIGQDHAMAMIARRVQTSRAGLDNPNKPIGVFMLAGPSGVGKTETALALAEALYGGEQNLITINMSEFQEAHTVSTLKGSPPGYVDSDRGGVLTEAVRRKPYSVVLLDEIEKAHPDVHEMFFQVFDKGWMDDSRGIRIDFRNTLILLTSNVGSELIMSMCQDPELAPDPEALAQAMRKPLLEKFPAALLGRIVTIPYFPLSDRMLETIIRLQIRRIERRIKESHDIPFTYDDSMVELVRKRCTEVESGGRMVDAILTNTVLPTISREILERTMSGAGLHRVHVTVQDSDFAYRVD